MIVSVLTMLAMGASVGGGLTYVFFPTGLEAALGSMLKLEEGSFLYPQYMRPPFKTISTYYLFELKNPNQFLSGSKPLLAMKGPYKYTAELARDNIAFLNSKQILSYDSHRIFSIAPDDSADFDEEFYHLNPIVPTVVTVVKRILLDKIPFRRLAEPVVFNMVGLLLQQYRESLVVRGTPRKFLGGSKVELLETITGLTGRIGLGGLIRGPPDNVFGIVYALNKTIDPLEIYTGVGPNKDKFPQVHKWRGLERNVLWRDRCNAIEGTNGELYKPMPVANKSLKVFLPQLCRSLQLDPVGEVVQIHDGLNALEYRLTDKLYKGIRSYPQNRCYCDDERTYDCQLDGLVRVSPCYYDTPIFFSRLGLEGVDPRIREFVEQESLVNNLPYGQSFYLDPITAAALSANLSFMALIKVVRQPYLRGISRVQNLTYYPTFIVAESFQMPFSSGWQIRALQLINDYHKPASAVVAVGGAAVMLLKLFVPGL